MNLLHLSVAVCFVIMIILIAKIIIDKINDSKVLDTVKEEPEFPEGKSPIFDSEMIWKGDKVEVFKITDGGMIAHIINEDGLIMVVPYDDLLSIDEWEDIIETKSQPINVNYVPVPVTFNETNTDLNDVKLTGRYKVTDIEIKENGVKLDMTNEPPQELIIDTSFSISNEDFVPIEDNSNNNSTNE